MAFAGQVCGCSTVFSDMYPTCINDKVFTRTEVVKKMATHTGRRSGIRTRVCRSQSITMLSENVVISTWVSCEGTLTEFVGSVQTRSAFASEYTKLRLIATLVFKSL